MRWVVAVLLMVGGFALGPVPGWAQVPGVGIPGAPAIPAPAVPGPVTPAPAPSSSGPQAAIMTPPPAMQDQFIKAVDEARQAYASGLNDMVRGVARPRRAEALCRIVPRGQVVNWVGRLSVLASSPGGKGVIVIEVAPKILFATNRTEAADERDKTLIDPRSPLFGYAAVLSVGDRVQFSGTLIQGGDDCFREVGKDTATSMAAPEFIFRLDSIKRVVPPTATAVLTGQAQPMTLAQSSQYVRDSVDVIAGAVACGVEQRRVFSTIIKVLMKAAAGQPNEQRDNLITMMFTPPSQDAQKREDCDGKVAGFERLEAEVSQ